jgi:DNA-binding response OmpR family regulator
MNLINIESLIFRWPWTRRRCLLLVEDNSSDAQLFAMAASECGWKCAIATSAEMADGYLHSRKYPIVVVDMRLPGQPGWDFVAQIIEQYPEPFLVAMAGSAFDLSYMPTGIFSSFITKPGPGQTYGPALRRLFKQARV